MLPDKFQEKSHIFNLVALVALLFSKKCKNCKKVWKAGGGGGNCMLLRLSCILLKLIWQSALSLIIDYTLIRILQYFILLHICVLMFILY